MDKLIPWRGFLVQIALMGCLLYFAKIAPEMHIPIMTTFAGLAGLLTQRARNQAGSDGGNSSGSSDGTSMFPSEVRTTTRITTKQDGGSHTPRSAVRLLQGIAIAALSIFAAALLLHCNQPPAQTATEVEAGVAIAKGICTEIGVATNDPIVTLLCPFLDKSGVPDSGKRSIIVTMPREQWMAIKARDGGP